MQHKQPSVNGLIDRLAYSANTKVHYLCYKCHYQASSLTFYQVRCSSGRQTAAGEAKQALLCCLATYMYLSSDSLLTRMSLILSIFRSSPSMSSAVMVESAMETTSSSEGQTELSDLGMLFYFMQVQHESQVLAEIPKYT